MRRFLVLAALLAFVSGSAAAASAPPPAAALRDALLRLALTQAEHPSPRWDPTQRDCAGFVRFLYATAVTGRAEMWRDRNGARVAYLRAEELLAYNFRRIDAATLQTGDLLAFHDETKPPLSAWHLMVVLEPPPGAPRETLLAYHNGATGKDAAVRQVWLKTLYERDWTAWRPDATNPRFLGAFRWLGWETSK